MRQIVLDTETTGLSPEEGHRIIEIGCVELLDRRLTRNRFHVYLNPDRPIDPGAIDVHGISNEFLADKPRFQDVAADFLAFIKDAELIIHNAPFDVGFLNHELARFGTGYGGIETHCQVQDTLALARSKHPGQRNSLDALCKRYGIDNSHRELHGALLDAEILADVYLLMTGGQASLLSGLEDPSTPASTPEAAVNPVRKGSLKVISCSSEEMMAHEARLAAIAEACGDGALWNRKD